MGGSRRRLVGLMATVLAVTVGLVAPATLSQFSADASGDPFNVNTWTDPDGGHHLVRWNPCQTITFAVNPRLAGHSAHARARAVRDVRGSFARAGQRSGLTFKFAGRTHELPRNTPTARWSERQKVAEIVVAWVDESRKKYHTDLLATSGDGYVSGVGGWILRGWTDEKSHWQAAVGRGYVVINSADNHIYAPGFGSGVTRGSLLQHEIGHAIGLSHVGSTSELMYPTILSRHQSTYKQGDSEGLHRLGRHQGCIPGANKIWPQI